MSTVIDHIVVVAPDLAAGAAYVSSVLGVVLQQGGAHPRMATHNLVMRLGESTYLEVIAPDPAAPRPLRPRWFALDSLPRDARPALAAWVVRTADIHASSASCTSVVGSVVPMERGSLSWLITVPVDGSLPLGGAAPMLIEWQSKPHPAGALRDVGCSLQKLEIFHPQPGRVQAILNAIELATPVSIQQLAQDAPPALVAHIQTPHGLRTL